MLIAGDRRFISAPFANEEELERVVLENYEYIFGPDAILLPKKLIKIFARWLDDLRDLRARARIQARIERLAAGNPGDAKAVGEGVSELRIEYGPGYRVYFKRRGRRLIILLAGGDKSSQANDIKKAHRLVRDLEE